MLFLPCSNTSLLSSVCFSAVAMSSPSRRTRISSSTRGPRGPGAGKHIVLLAGDHEYRSEESLPALARILAKHYGFKCSVFFTTDPQTGFIEPGSSQHRRARGAEDGRPAGRLPALPGFSRRGDAAHRRLPRSRRPGRRLPHRDARVSDQAARREVPEISLANAASAYPGGFGRQILGETWVSHYGTNHKMSSRLLLQPTQASASDPARREGRLGAVGRLHGESDRGQRRPGERARSSTA